MTQGWETYFDDYLDGQLAPDKAAAFEDSLRSDAHLREAFEKHKAARTIAEAFLEKEVRSTIKNLKGAEKNPSSDPSGNIQKFFTLQSAIPKYVATAAILAGLTFGVYKYDQHRKLLARHELAIKTESNLFKPETTRSITELQTKRDSAVHYFNTNELDKSQALWEKIGGEESKIYQARIQLRKRKYDNALKLLESLSSDEQKILEYYIIYVNEGNIEAKKYINSMPDSIVNRIEILEQN